MKTLRIGFLLDGPQCPKWQLDIIARIQKTNELEICLFALNGEHKKISIDVTKKKTNKLISLLWKLSKPLRLIWSIFNPSGYGIPIIYHRFDHKYNGHLNHLWDKDNIPKCSSAITVILNPIRKNFTHRFIDTDLKTITDCQLDVLIRFGFSIIRGDIHHTSRYGVWSFHHGDNRFYRGGPPGIWELIKGKREISVTLQQLNDTLDCGKTIGRFTHRADLFSALKNKHLIYSSCGDLLMQKLLQVQRIGFTSIQSTSTYQENIEKTNILKSPKNIECLALIKTLILHYIELRWPRNKKIQWFLATKPIDDQLNSFQKASLIFAPKDRFYADPFLIEHEGKHFVFFEEFIYKSKLAHISVGELKDNKLSNIQPIIEDNFHLSYPFIFKDNDKWYLIPETRQNQCVSLYHCVKFPYQWQLDSIIMDQVELLDATIHKQDDTYFLFANQYEPKRNTSNEKLVVYFSENLRGPWQAHPMNPLTTDITNSRPAGKIFNQKNKLILPTQNCALRYGNALNFNEIEISKTYFSMEKISTLSPHWHHSNLGSHTWNSNNQSIIIDGHRYIDR